jgi:hypothetical protein
MNARVGQDTRARCPTVSRRADGNNTLMKTQIQATEVRDFIRSLHLCTPLFETSNFCILFKKYVDFSSDDSSDEYCSSHDECHKDGACVYNEAIGHYQCMCQPPFSGDGRRCFREPQRTCVFNSCFIK